MSYLKLIANAAWAGFYGSILITFLLFFLNDELTAPDGAVLRFVGALLALAVFYLPAIALILPTLFVCVRFFAARPLGIRWAALKAVVWFGVATQGAMCAVFYLNLRWAVSLQSPPARDALRISFTLMAACWLGAVGTAGLGQFRHGALGRSHRRVAAAFLLLPLPAMGVLLAGLPGPGDGAPTGPPREVSGRDRQARPLVIVGVEAASMDEILPLVTERELPEFERFFKEGASARLNTIAPCVSRAAWTTLGSGMPPWATGVKDTQLYSLAAPWGLPAPSGFGVLPVWVGMGALQRAGLVVRAPSDQTTGRRPMFWEVLRQAGIAVEVIGWPGSEPASTGPGVAVDDARVAARLEKILGTPLDDLQAVANGSSVDVLRRAIAEDLTARDEALAARAGRGSAGARVLAVRFPGLGAVSRRFLRYQHPAEFGDVAEEDLVRYGKVLSRYYGFVDTLVAEQAEAAGPSARIMVVSAHGVAPVSWWERLVRSVLDDAGAAESAPSGSWRRGPDGALLIRGEGVAPGTRLEEADIQDIVPTVLYLLELPIERDLRGGLIRRLFSPEFLEAHPMQLVPGRATMPRRL